MRELARLGLAVAIAVASWHALAGADPHEAFRHGRYEEAARGFEALRANRPRDPAIDVNLGSALYALGRFEEAAAAFERAAVAASGAVRQQALYDLGNAAFRLERFDQAARHFEEALRLDPEDADAAFNLELARDRLAAPAPTPPPPSGGPSGEDEHRSSARQEPTSPEETSATRPAPAERPGSPGTSGSPRSQTLTRQEAERLLSSIEDQPPPRERDRKARRRARTGKDW